jgi:hypothetical protein
MKREKNKIKEKHLYTSACCAGVVKKMCKDYFSKIKSKK